MPKFRKKSITVEAVQWFRNGDHPGDACQMIYPDPNSATQFEPFLSGGKAVRYFRHPDIAGDSPCSECKSTYHSHGWIDTLEEGHRVCPGDWIITGVKGERYPCKPDVFLQSYEPEEDDQWLKWISSRRVS